MEEWKEIGKPAAESHWVRGRSAYELAADWIRGDAVDRTVELLRSRPEFEGLELIDGVAEKKTPFDSNPRGPRNHDLLVSGRSTEGTVVIGVEGKADEPFDLPLWLWRQRRVAERPNSDAPRRLDALTSLFFGSVIDEDRDQPSLGCLGYQLLSALAGTLADAQAEDAVRAVLLIHEFVTDKTDDARHARNAKALEDFLARIGGTELGRTEVGDDWVTGPVMIHGDGTYMPSAVPVSVAKLVTEKRGKAS